MTSAAGPSRFTANPNLPLAESINIEVAAGNAEHQVVVTLVVQCDTTAEQAVLQANLENRIPGFRVDMNRLGVFGRPCKPDQRLNEGDRVEVYRPLKADPKEVRRQLAELERARGKKAGQ